MFITECNGKGQSSYALHCTSPSMFFNDTIHTLQAHTPTAHTRGPSFAFPPINVGRHVGLGGLGGYPLSDPTLTFLNCPQSVNGQTAPSHHAGRFVCNGESSLGPRVLSQR